MGARNMEKGLAPLAILMFDICRALRDCEIVKKEEMKYSLVLSLLSWRISLEVRWYRIIDQIDRVNM